MAALLATVASRALAAAEGAPAANNAAQVEEVVVTAQKRSENLQDVAIAITAVGRAQLEQTHAAQLSDLETAVPNVSFGHDGRTSFGEVGIRGVSDSARTIGNDSRVGVYIDGVLQGRSYAEDADLIGVERVEVLRGPQGALFGRGTDAGAISISTRPASGAAAVELGGEAGNFGSRHVWARIDQPLADNLYAALSLGSRYSDGYIENLTLHRDLNGDDSQSARGQLRYAPDGRFELILSADLFRDKAAVIGQQSIRAAGDFGGFAAAPGPYVVAQDTDTRATRHVSGVSATLNQTLADGAVLTAITAYRTALFRAVNDEDYGPRFVAVSLPDESNQQFTQELRYTSPRWRAGDFVAGLYYFDQAIDTDRRVVTGPAFALGPRSVEAPGEVKGQEIAAYFHGDYRPIGWLELAGGLRATQETKSIVYSIADTTGLFANFTDFRDRFGETQVSPSVSLNIHPADGVMLYASVSTGSKSGGWNADYIRTLQGIRFGGETATNYEIGVKSEAFDHTLRLNLAVFRADYQHFQIQQYVPVPGGGTIITYANAGAARSQGVEFEALWKPSSYVSFGGNAAHTDAAFTEFRNGGGPGIDYTGRTLPFAPRWKTYVFTELSGETGAGEVRAYLAYAFEGRSWSNPSNTAAYQGDPITDLTARLIFRPAATPLQYALWAKNLGDEDHFRTRDVSFLGVQRGTVEAPRTFGLTITGRF